MSHHIRGAHKRTGPAEPPPLATPTTSSSPSTLARTASPAPSATRPPLSISQIELCLLCLDAKRMRVAGSVHVPPHPHRPLARGPWAPRRKRRRLVVTVRPGSARSSLWGGVVAPPCPEPVAFARHFLRIVSPASVGPRRAASCLLSMARLVRCDVWSWIAAATAALGVKRARGPPTAAISL